MTWSLLGMSSEKFISIIMREVLTLAHVAATCCTALVTSGRARAYGQASARLRQHPLPYPPIAFTIIMGTRAKFGKSTARRVTCLLATHSRTASIKEMSTQTRGGATESYPSRCVLCQKNAMEVRGRNKSERTNGSSNASFAVWRSEEIILALCRLVFIFCAMTPSL